MAPVEINTPVSLLPAATVFSHIFFAAYLSVLVGRTIYRSYLALPPSSSTRLREPLRRGHVQLFAGLAIVSYLVAQYYGVKFSSLSYRIWATERSIELPEGLFGDKGALRGGEHPGRLHIARWLNDTPFYQDALEIVAEKARYFWWGQQVNLGAVSWSVFLGIEGQRRKIPYLWAFMALAQLVNLSYAQNLFFLALLLTPVPLPENVKELTRSSVPVTSSKLSQLVNAILPSKPDGWAPNPKLYITLLLSSYITAFLVPFASNTPSFMTVNLISRALLFTPLLLPYIVPESWGTIHSHHPHETYSSYTTIFRTISTISFLLHLKSTALGLFYNSPESHYYRHSLLQPFKEEHRSALSRGTTAFERVFGAIGEHPAITAVGWDVLLSGLSVGIWAAIRGLDGIEMLGSSIPFLKRTEKEQEGSISTFKTENEDAFQKSKPTARRVGRPKKSETSSSELTNGVSGATKRRGRSKRTSIEDEAYTPSESDQFEEGDEDAEADWEIGAFTWGLITASGLGAGSAAVFGAEVMAR